MLCLFHSEQGISILPQRTLKTFKRRKSGNPESLQRRTDWRNSDQLVTFTLNVFVLWFIDCFASVGTTRTSQEHHTGTEDPQKNEQKCSTKVHRNFKDFKDFKNFKDSYWNYWAHSKWNTKISFKKLVDFCWQIEAFHVVTQTTIIRVLFCNICTLSETIWSFYTMK